jgi:hypothetical protein
MYSALLQLDFSDLMLVAVLSLMVICSRLMRLEFYLAIEALH